MYSEVARIYSCKQQARVSNTTRPRIVLAVPTVGLALSTNQRQDMFNYLLHSLIDPSTVHDTVMRQTPSEMSPKNVLAPQG